MKAESERKTDLGLSTCGVAPLPPRATCCGPSGAWAILLPSARIAQEIRGCKTVQAYKTEVRIEREGELRLADLPFRAGDEVEVIVLRRESAPPSTNPYPLRGRPLRYEDPTEPVAEDDWEALH